VGAIASLLIKRCTSALIVASPCATFARIKTK
jgi:hypothetical protein